MQYDGVGRPSRQSVTRGGHTLYNRSYRWDDDYRLSHAHDAISGRGARYLYDDFGSLTEAEYGDGARLWRNPDIMGNVYDSADRTDRMYARGGQLREDRRWWYHYDKQGNLVLKTKRKIPHAVETPRKITKTHFLPLFVSFSNLFLYLCEQNFSYKWEAIKYQIKSLRLWQFMIMELEATR